MKRKPKPEATAKMIERIRRAVLKQFENEAFRDEFGAICGEGLVDWGDGERDSAEAYRRGRFMTVYPEGRKPVRFRIRIAVEQVK